MKIGLPSVAVHLRFTCLDAPLTHPLTLTTRTSLIKGVGGFTLSVEGAGLKSTIKQVVLDSPYRLN